MRFLVVVAVNVSRIRVNAIRGSCHPVVGVGVVVLIVVVVAVAVVLMVGFVVMVVIRQGSEIVISLPRVPCSWGTGRYVVCLAIARNHASNRYEINGCKPSELLFPLSHNVSGKWCILCQFPNIR